MSPPYALRGIPDLVPGDHLCCLYETEEEHRAVLTPFLRQGLERGEKVLYIVDARTAEAVLAYLRENGLEVEPYLARGQLSILTRDDAYMRQGVFDPDGMIALVRTETARALAEGYSALRASGETTWALRGLPGSGRLIEYEAKLNTFFPGSQCLGLCQYDRRRVDPAVLLEVLATHPTAVVGTAVYDNLYYLPPQELLAGDVPAATLRHWLENLAARKRREEALRKRTDDLNKRVKELNCLYAISRLVDKRDLSIEQVLLRVVECMPPAWQDPEVTCARIIVEGREFRTHNFAETTWGQSSDIIVSGNVIGTVEVYYLAERPEQDEGPFLKEERKLLDAIAERIGEAIERQRAEQALRESEEQFRKLVEHASDWVWEVNEQGIYTYAGPEVRDILGYAPEEVLGKSPFDLMPPNEAKRVAEIFAPISEARGPFALLENVNLHKDGHRVILEASGTPIFDSQGVFRGYCGIDRDITERKWAEEALLARTLQLEAVRAVTAEISRELDLAALLELINRRAGELVGAASGTVRLWDEQAELLIPVAWHGLGEWMKHQCRRLGEGLSGTVAQRREGMIVNDYRTSPYAHPATLERTKIAAVLAEPLIYRDRLLGVLTVDNHEPGQPFTEQDQELFRIFAAHAAIAIENARLHSETLHRGEELAALLRAARTVMSGLDLQTTLERIIEEAAQIAGTPHVQVLLVEKGARVLRVAALHGMAAWHVGFVLPVGTSLSGLTAQTRQPVFSEDLAQDPRNLFAQQDRELGLVTHLSLPIKLRDEVLGVLTFKTTAPRQYTPDEVAYLTSFADHAAIAIENARLFEEGEQGRKQLHALAARLAEAEEAERQRLARELHDQVGQNLTALGINLNILRTQMLGKAAGPVRSRLDDSLALVEQTTDRIRDVMADLRPPGLDDYGLLAALRWYGVQFSSRMGIAVDVQGEELVPRLATSVENALFRISQEALNNVAKHARVAKVRVAVESGGGNVRLVIADEGIGFDPSRQDKPAGHQRWGLVTMSQRATAVGGYCRIESRPGEGTRVVVEVPR